MSGIADVERAAQLSEQLGRRKYWFRLSVAGVLGLSILVSSAVTYVFVNRDRWSAETAFAEVLCATRNSAGNPEPPESLQSDWAEFVDVHGPIVESLDDVDTWDIDWLSSATRAMTRGDALWGDLSWGARVERFDKSKTLGKFRKAIGNPRC